jgi:hypothetical protein
MFRRYRVVTIRSSAIRSRAFRLSLALLVAAVFIGGRANLAAATPGFQMPFPCNEVWYASTYPTHLPSRLSIDWNLSGMQDAGRPVQAGISGIATVKADFVAGQNRYGNYVDVDAGGGWVTRYAHLGGVSIRSGQAVTPQTQIGTVGSSGLINSSAYHLHYEQRINGVVQAAVFNGRAITYSDSLPGIPYTSANCTAPTANYQPMTADFNKDGFADIGLRDTSIGRFFIKHGQSFGDQISYPWAAGSHYQSLAADFNNDGFADIGLRDSSNGIFYIKHGQSFGDQISYPWAAGSHYQSLAADFNGDGYADIALRDTTTGTFHFKLGPSFAGGTSYQWAAGSHYAAFAADFNGDRLADIGLRDSSNGTFYFKVAPSFGGGTNYPWAVGSNYQPFAADFNHDGLADIGLRNSSNGIFFIKHGPQFGDQITYQWAAG